MAERNRQLELKMHRGQPRDDDWRALVDDLGVIVWEAEAEARTRRFSFVNRYAEALLGYPIPRWLDEPGFWSDLVHPEDRDRIVGDMGERIRDLGGYELEYRVVTADERVVWLREIVHVVRDDDGSPEALRGVMMDVTEQHRAAEGRDASLERERSQLEAAARRATFLAEAGALLASSTDYASTLEGVARMAVPQIADYCIVDLLGEGGGVERLEVAAAKPTNDALAETLARHPPDPQARHLFSTVLSTGVPQLVRRLSPAVLEAIAREPAHLEVLERIAPTSMIVVPLLARGRTLGLITLVTAESGRRLGRAELALAEELARRAAVAIDNAELYRETRAASEAKSKFLAIMSHELRTPLNAVIGYTDLLDSEVTEPLTDRQTQQVRRIDASSKHLLHLIDQILTFSRMEAREEQIRTERVDFAELAREAAETVEPLARRKGLDVRVRTPEEPLELETDGGKVRQILLNLLSNAVKFTNAGEIEVAAASENGRAALRVRDTGIGIAPEHLDEIFEPFHQIEESKTREAGGTGVGLSVTKRLAEVLSGRITVESALGEGSTFTVEFPLRIKVPAS